MRKFITILLLVILVVTLAMPAMAAGTTIVTISADKTTAYRGDTINFTVKVSGDGVHTALGLKLSYDTGVFEFVSAKANASGAPISDFDTNQKVFTIGYGDAGKHNGTIGTFTLKVKSAAGFSTKSVSGTLTAKNGSSSVSSSMKGASITVACKHSFGSSTKVDGTYHQRTCSICKYVQKTKHDYDNGCDSKCNTCGATRTTSHKYKTQWSSTDKYHYHACSICGDWADTQAHTPGAAATEQAAQTCTVCGHILSAQLEHVHDKQPEIQWDETGHWYNCNTCEEKADFQEHVYEFACSETCSVCGYKREVTHTPGEQMQSDETGHWYDCEICKSKVDFAQHSGDITAQDPKCDVCGYTLVHTHNYSEAWSGDAVFHWHACTCGAKDGEAGHTWDEGVVTKQATWTQKGEVVFTCSGCNMKMECMTQNLLYGHWVFWLVCGGLGVAVLTMGIVLIVICVKAKGKSKGKYATVKIS